MATAILLDGGVSTLSNAVNPSTTTYYYAFTHGTKASAFRGATLQIDALTGGTLTIAFSNDTMVDGGAPAGTDEYNATAAQLNNLTWFDRTKRFSSGGTATISATQIIDFDTNISFRLMRLDFTTNNATNSLNLRFRRN